MIFALLDEIVAIELHNKFWTTFFLYLDLIGPIKIMRNILKLFMIIIINVNEINVTEVNLDR